MDSSGSMEITTPELFSQLASLKSTDFTGQVILVGSKQLRWVLHMFMGRLVYASGGKHPIRRWHRQLLQHWDGLDTGELNRWIPQHSSAEQECWEYELMCGWYEQGSLNRNQITAITQGILEEVLFDLIHEMKLKFHIEPVFDLPKQLVLIDPIQLTAAQRQIWQKWRSAKVADRSPNLAPVISQPLELEARTHPALYQNLTRLLDGKQTIRDLAIQNDRSPLMVMVSLLPYLQTGIINLVEVSDLCRSDTYSTSKPQRLPALVACVDDSAWVCDSLQLLMNRNGYRFIGIRDPLRAVPTLLTQSPELILLDLRMPNTNGYELCGQLRRITKFQTTPIIILTGNDGIIDRVRARMVGATDFLSKSVDDETLLSTVARYLPQDDLNSSGQGEGFQVSWKMQTASPL